MPHDRGPRDRRHRVGDWYLETTSIGTIVATNVRTGRVVTIDTPELVNLGTAYAAIVVG